MHAVYLYSTVVVNDILYPIPNWSHSEPPSLYINPYLFITHNNYYNWSLIMIKILLSVAIQNKKQTK